MAVDVIAHRRLAQPAFGGDAVLAEPHFSKSLDPVGGSHVVGHSAKYRHGYVHVNSLADNSRAYAPGMKSVGERVRHARVTAGFKQTALARAIGIKQPTLSALESGESAGTEYLPEIERETGFRAQWLKTGRGRQRLNDLDPEKHVIVGAPSDMGEMVFVAAVTGAHLSAGSGEILWDADEETNAVAFRRDWMQSKGLRPERCKVWRVRGESMEPRFSHGDSLLLDMSDRAPRHGKFFALVGEDGSRVKQLRATGSGGWEMYSLNPDKTRFPTEPIFHDNYAIIGRVRGRSGDED